MIEIRRIADEEGDRVADLWDRMCREVPDGGPLPPGGHRKIARMLAMSAWHQHAFCLVAVDGEEIVGFVNGRTEFVRLQDPQTAQLITDNRHKPAMPATRPGGGLRPLATRPGGLPVLKTHKPPDVT